MRRRRDWRNADVARFYRPRCPFCRYRCNDSCDAWSFVLHDVETMRALKRDGDIDDY